jgi:hypothetical protein
MLDNNGSQEIVANIEEIVQLSAPVSIRILSGNKILPVVLCSKKRYYMDDEILQFQASNDNFIQV